MTAAYCLMEETKEREERGRKKKGGREGGMRKEKGEREKWSKSFHYTYFNGIL